MGGTRVNCASYLLFWIFTVCNGMQLLGLGRVWRGKSKAAGQAGGRCGRCRLMQQAQQLWQMWQMQADSCPQIHVQLNADQPRKQGNTATGRISPFCC